MTMADDLLSKVCLIIVHRHSSFAHLSCERTAKNDYVSMERGSSKARCAISDHKEDSYFL